jgi:hypothetical protein
MEEFIKGLTPGTNRSKERIERDGNILKQFKQKLVQSTVLI